MDYFIKGNIKRIVYFNQVNNFTILKVELIETNIPVEEVRRLQSDSFYITISGYFPQLAQENTYIFYGEIKSHKKYGEQFNAMKYETSINQSFQGLIHYLSSDLFKGVGEKTATKIVVKLGIDCIQKIQHDRSILDEVKGISEAAKMTIYDGIVKHKDIETIFTKLYSYELSSLLATRIYEVYKENTILILEQNPYQLIDDIDRIGFKRADEIARKIGIDYDDPKRISAAIKYLIKRASEEFGFTYLTYQQLYDNVIKFVNNETFELQQEQFNQYVEELIHQLVIIKEDDYYFSYDLYEAEIELANNIHNIMKYDVLDKYSESDIIQSIDIISKRLMIEYSEKQYEAIKRFQNEKVMILTGGPGTGKTTVIKGIIETYLMLHNMKIKNSLIDNDMIGLVAPTGRAAKKLSEATQYYASTIHKFLGYSYEGIFQYDEYNQVIKKLLIIDEASMIDVYLAAHLFKTIDEKTQILIVGDHNQLPSVGPGQVLSDLLNSGVFPTVELDEIHRQAMNSSIVQLSHKINLGIYDQSLFESYDDYTFIKTDDIEDSIISSVEDAVNAGYDLLNDIQVIIPIYKGKAGITNINKILQHKFNPAISGQREIVNGERVFRLNDKVMQLKNQADLGIMNGDIGLVVGFNETQGALSLVVDFDSNVVEYQNKDLINLTHAYAISVHKAQGSEYPIVMFPLVKGYYQMLKRKLVYTGVTRAKQSLLLMGDPYALKIAVQHIEGDRQTRLVSRLLDVFEQSGRILDASIPFDVLEEEDITPYDFLEEDNE